MRRQGWFLSFLVLFLAFSPSSFARDWNASDSDLPGELKGMSQGQLDIINKTNELNPASPTYSPNALKQFKDYGVAPAAPESADTGAASNPPVTEEAGPVIRTKHDTTELPPLDSGFTEGIGGTPGGIGLAPSPSDGPTIRPGEPPPPTRSAGDRAADEGHFGIFFGELFLGKEEFAKAADIPDPFRRSGSRFGDCVGADCIPHLGFPGEPLGGPPLGSWVDFLPGRANFSFATDQVLLNAIGGGNIEAARANLSAALGRDVAVDPNDRGF